MSGKDQSSNRGDHNPGHATTLKQQAGRNPGQIKNHTRRKSCIPPHILDQAVDLVAKRIKCITKETALDFDISRPLMRLAWNLLHQGEFSVNNVATILESWAHREISNFGDEARPNREKLHEWADEIDTMLRKVNKALSSNRTNQD
ncbi:MAG: hypothetical protein ACYTF1_21320 [Planctomycetota bacterium]